LTKEAERFYATTANQLKITKNEIVNTAIELGGTLLPVLRNANDLFSGFVDVLGVVVGWFTRLPGPVQGVVGIFLALLAALGPVLIIVGQMAIAWAALVPIATGLGIGVGALLATFLLIPAAIAALVAAGLAIYKNWFQIKELAMMLADAVVIAWNRMIDKLKEIIAPVTKVIDVFRTMYDKIVGHSYVPDMMRGISREFDKLDAIMVRPSTRAIESVVESFRKAVAQLTGQQQLLIEAMSRQGTAAQQLKDMRLDLALTTDADSAEKLRERIAEVTGEFNRLTGIVTGLEPVRAEMERIADVIDRMDAGLDSTLKKFREVSSQSAGAGLQTTTPAVIVAGPTPPPPPEIAGLLGIIGEWGEALGVSIPTIAWLGQAAEDSAGFLINAGKSFLRHVGNLFESVFKVFNPLAIVSNVLTGAFQKAGAALEGPFGDAINAIVAVLVEALTPVLNALVPVFDALVPIIRELAPIISAVAQILAVLFKAIMPIVGALVPLLRALFPVFKFLAIVATYLGQIFAKAAQIVAKIISAFAQIVGNVVVVIGKAIDALPFVSGKPIINFGKGLLNASDEMDRMADGFGQAFTELGDAREEIKGITLDEPMQNAANNLNGVGDAAAAAADSLWGVAGRSPIADTKPFIPAPTTTNIGNAVPGAYVNPEPSANVPPIVIEGGVTINTSGDGEETYQNFRSTLATKARSAGPEAQKLLRQLPI
jgi:hypothetical protein